MFQFTRSRHRICSVALICAMAGACADASAGAVPSGVGIVAEGCGLAASVGSGAVIARGDGDAVVVTVAHTIKGADRVTVVDDGGVRHAARVVAFDKDADLAALAVADLVAPALAVAADTGSSLDGTDGSILTWDPDDGVEQVPVGIVKRLVVTIEDIYIDDEVERTALEIAGPVVGGDSGGPVLDAEGDVTGIIYASSRGRDLVGFATDQAELADLLDAVTGATVSNGTCF